MRRRSGAYYGRAMRAGITVDGDGNVVAADWNSDQVYVIAGQTATVYGRTMIRGHYYLVAGVSDASQPGNGGPVEPRSKSSRNTVAPARIQVMGTHPCLGVTFRAQG